MKIERKSGREITKSNSDVYKQSVDVDIIVKNVLNIISNNDFHGYSVIQKEVELMPVKNNRDEYVRFKNKIIIIEPELVPLDSELLKSDKALINFKCSKYTLNQLLGAYGQRKCGINYNPKDDIYMTPIHVSARLDKTIICEDYLINIKRVNCINLNTFKEVIPKEPLTSKQGSQDNQDYFIYNEKGLPYGTYNRYKCLTLQEIDEKYLPEKRCNLFGDDTAIYKYIIVHNIDNNKLNSGIKNIVPISNGENTKLTAQREIRRYEIENKFGEVKTFFKFKELVDYIYNLEIVSRNFINNISNLVYNAIKYDGEGRIKDYTIRMVVDEDKLNEWKIKRSVRNSYLLTARYGSSTVQYFCENAKAHDRKFSELTGNKESSSARLRRSMINQANMENCRGTVTSQIFKPQQKWFWEKSSDT